MGSLEKSTRIPERLHNDDQYQYIDPTVSVNAFANFLMGIHEASLTLLVPANQLAIPFRIRW